MNNINMLKEKLDNLLNVGAPYDEIYAVSVQIDKLLVEYYMNTCSSKIHS